MRRLRHACVCAQAEPSCIACFVARQCVCGFARARRQSCNEERVLTAANPPQSIGVLLGANSEDALKADFDVICPDVGELVYAIRDMMMAQSEGAA